MRPLPLALAAVILFLVLQLVELPVGSSTGLSVRVPGFRDGVHYYAPLFQYLYEEIVQGRQPLWNPYENLGQPLAANPTTMLFYPGTLLVGLGVFLGLNVFTAYSLFVSGHLLLAIITCYRLARYARCSPFAASIAGLCYALGGNVLFQWHNVPFLVGAAWFPEALRLADQTLRHHSRFNVAALGTVLALMILGGDPQAAYHVGICVVIMLALSPPASCPSPLAFRLLPFAFRPLSPASCLLPLASSLLLAFCLAAVQILPAWELGQLSDRTLESHRIATLFFSVPPWRLVEFFWPGAGGWQFPQHTRWFSALTAEGRIWVPSFYMGTVPCLAALFGIVSSLGRIRRSLRRRNTQAFRSGVLLTILCVFLLGGLGTWCYVYSVLQFLPGYEAFRYPAKLLVVASLMFAVLGARELDRLVRNRRRCLLFLACYRGFVLVGVTLFSLLALCQGLILWQDPHSSFFPLLGPVPPCPLFGPFCGREAGLGMIFSIVTVSVAYLLVDGATRWRVHKHLLLCVILTDLLLANSWMLATVSPSVFREPSPLMLERDSPNDFSDKKHAPIRIYRHPLWYPPEFATNSSVNRLTESVIWDRDSLFPRHSLPLRINLIDVRGTLMSKDYYPLAGRLRTELKAGDTDDFQNSLEQLGVDYVITPQDVQLKAESVPMMANWPKDVQLWKLSKNHLRQFVLYEPNRLIWDVDLEGAETIVLTEQYWPGWRAFANGKEIPIRPVEGVFRGVDLPAGQYRMEMVYDPPLLKIGAVLSLLGMLALLLLVALRRRSCSKTD